MTQLKPLANPSKSNHPLNGSACTFSVQRSMRTNTSIPVCKHCRETPTNNFWTASLSSCKHSARGVFVTLQQQMKQWLHQHEYAGGHLLYSSAAPADWCVRSKSDWFETWSTLHMVTEKSTTCWTASTELQHSSGIAFSTKSGNCASVTTDN